MTREDIDNIISIVCPNDEDFEKPIISPAYLKKELETLALEEGPCSNCCNGNQIEKAKLCQKSYLAGMEHKQEPSGDLISREAVIEIQTKYAEYIGATKFWQMRDDIKALPPVTQKSKIGYWFAWKPEDDVWRTTCSECGEETRTLWDYCPHCGAKMVEPQESEE